ncbi:hypothetical protein CTI12_AA298210 [Artemisia annua]|uniref:Uncharacterized protein n=1 Tax=Artemisia annua TaxID=35608 RepID=A0A2U1N7J0_ARTAN|nr:hypothetical protein CTI12_AA298210 [Artemisia annua]
METLVVYAQNGDQYHSRNRNFQHINCRTSQYGVGILPNPNIVFKQNPYDGNAKQLNRITKSSSVSIPIGVRENITDSMTEIFCSERWAGPAYSSSPPPSSLPIPNFSIKPKRTVSLDLHTVSASDVDLLALLSKSAPTSPTSGGGKFSEIEFVNACDDCDNSATKTLRRILNLDMVESD